MAAIGEAGHFDSALCSCLHFERRGVTGDTLPFTAGHLHPCIGPALIGIDKLSGWVGEFAGEAARHDGRVAKYCYLHIRILDAGIFGRFRCREHLGLTGDFSVAAGTDEFVGQQRGD